MILKMEILSIYAQLLHQGWTNSSIRITAQLKLMSESVPQLESHKTGNSEATGQSGACMHTH